MNMPHLRQQTQLAAGDIARIIEMAKSTGKTFKVVSLAVGHHQMTEAPEETLFEISDFLK